MQIYDGRGRGGGRAVELAHFFFMTATATSPPLVKEIAERRPNYTGRSRGVSAALEDGSGGVVLNGLCGSSIQTLRLQTEN